MHQTQLKNGLTLFWGCHRDEPRIQTRLAFRAGSRFDPPGGAGTAHLVEHLLFKGTPRLGSRHPRREAAALAQLEALFEEASALASAASSASQRPTPAQNRLWRRIFRLSDKISTLAEPNAYDRQLAEWGVTESNAYTGLDETLFSAVVPSGSLESWLHLERERFEALIFRLFAVEREVILDEYFRDMDKDESRLNNRVMARLFSGTPYARPILGDQAFLEYPRPSLIRAWFHQYYRPENMVMVLSGDLHEESLPRVVEQIWGDWRPGPSAEKGYPSGSSEFRFPDSTSGHFSSVSLPGPDPEMVWLTWPLGGAGEDQRLLGYAADMVLYNQQAGLLDVNLIQKQKVMRAESAFVQYRDRGLFRLEGRPRSGQTLDEVARHLRTQLENLAQGKWDSRLLRGVVKDLRISRQERQEENRWGDSCASAFVEGRSWDDWLAFPHRLAEISQEDVCRWASDLLECPCLAAYKTQGDHEELPHRQTPPYRPRQGDTEAASLLQEERPGDHSTAEKDFSSGWAAPAAPLRHAEPRFADFASVLRQYPLAGGRHLYWVENRENRLFDLQLIFPAGKRHSSLLPLAVAFLDGLGTASSSPGELMREFYIHGLDWESSCEGVYTYMGFSGEGRDSLLRGLDLLSDMRESPRAREGYFQAFIQGVRKGRRNAKTRRRTILHKAMASRALYGTASPFCSVLPETELLALSERALLEELQRLFDTPFDLFYYGPAEEGLLSRISDFCPPRGTNNPYKERPFPVTHPEAGRVKFVHHDQGQTDILLLSAGPPLNLSLFPLGEMFCELYGNETHSLVFQEYREVRGLGYSGYAQYVMPPRREMPHLLSATLGLPPVRAAEGIEVMEEILRRRPVSQSEWDLVRDYLLRKIENERILRDDVFWHWWDIRQQGWQKNNRPLLYDALQKMKRQDFNHFLSERIAPARFSYLVLGHRDRLDYRGLETFGPVEEWTLEEIFP